MALKSVRCVRLGAVSDMSKIRLLSFDVVIFGLIVAGGLRANTMTTYSGNPYNINMDLSQPNVDNSNIVDSTSNDIVNNSNTNTNPYAYSNYGMSTLQNNNLCIMGFCGSSSTNYGMSFQNNLCIMGFCGSSYTSSNITVPTTTGDISTISNNQPPDPLLTVLPIGTTVTLPDLVIQPSNISTVTTNIPTIQVTTNFNLGVGDFADPEPSTVLLFVSGMVALGFLHRKRSKIGRIS
jgi:hypothetical protein